MPFWSTGPSIPLADQNPSAEAGTAKPGIMDMGSRADHVHPRLTATATGTLNSSGEATVTFTRTFPTKPGLTLTYAETADGQPVVFKVKTWTQDGNGNFVGCVIKGYRAQAIPTNLVTLLLGGVFNLFAGSPTGVEFSLIAVQAS